MRINPARYALIVITLLSLFYNISYSHAQTPPRTNAVIQYYENSDTDTKVYLASMAPDSKTPQKLTDINVGGSATLSPDGKILAVISGTDTQDTLSYGALNGKLNTIPVETGQRVLWTSFSPDSTLLAYTTIAQDNSLWLLGVVDVATGKRIELAGDYTDQTNKGAGFNGAGDVVGWSSDKKQVYLRTYFPFSASGGFDTLITLDISGFSFDKPGRYPMPAGTRLLPEGEQIINFAFAEDGTKFAVLYADPTNPAENFTGTEAAPNSVSVRELPSGKEIANFNSQKGQGLEFMIDWTPDSKKLVFAGGSYKSTFFPVQPTLHILDVDSKQVTDTALLDDPAVSLEGMLACADAVFFTAAVEDAQGVQTTTLYSTPLSSTAGAAQRSELFKSDYVPLSTCIPAIKTTP